jgi:outer membrane protein assembly factor BamB
MKSGRFPRSTSGPEAVARPRRICSRGTCCESASFRRDGLRRLAVAGTVVAAAVGLAWSICLAVSTIALSHAARAADDAADGDAGEGDAEAEGGIGFPGDRLRERQLDRSRRLVAEQRWSDAATLLDEILTADRDAFFRIDRQQRTWQSIKSEAGRLIGSLPAAGREAYELQFRARADRLLEQAVAANDSATVVAVARRWFHTPAGRRATLLSAIEALEANQPLAAAAWLDRLAAADSAGLEPTLSVMRATAWLRAGDRGAAAGIIEKAAQGGRTVVRLGGRDVNVSFPPGGGLDWLTALVGNGRGGAGVRGGEWTMHRGDAARNGIVAVSRPLLVPRYRVPLARHPEEARLLESRRRLAADQESPILPAGSALAVDGLVVLHTTMGLLAVDFETGKRIWLQPGSATAPAAADGSAERGDGDPPGTFSSVFEDATSGLLSSDGRCVFAVESHPDAVSSAAVAGRVGLPGMLGPNAVGGWRGGNTLSAYDLRGRGSLRWRLPVRGDEPAPRAGPGGATGAAWFLGAPLPVGDDLYVLVEEKGEIRLDVLDAATGHVAWSQPLAEVDEDRAVDSRDSSGRRLAGLSPALADGVLVCPTGAGAVVAVDLATRTLLWAYDYPQAVQSDAVVLPNGIRMRRGNVPGAGRMPGNLVTGREGANARWLDSAPILHEGRVLLAPGESPDLHCLDLRRGELLWKAPRKERLFVAGAVDGRVIVVGRAGVEALEMDGGNVAWQRPLGGDHGSPSGRGILAPQRLFLPLDTPEVVEIDLADGRIAGRSAARGNSVPGNLLAYRGEVISQGVDSLDVFHQSAPLDARIETALKADAGDAWATLWRGQLQLDAGDIVDGIAKVRAAHAAQPARVPASMVADALRFAIEEDFSRASGLWREAVALSGTPRDAAAVLRMAVDGFTRLGDMPQAWEAMRELLTQPADEAVAGVGPEPAVPQLVSDGADPHLAVTPQRWLQGRLADLSTKGSTDLRAELDAFITEQFVAAAPPPAVAAGQRDAARDARFAALRSCIERFGRHDAARAGRRRLLDLLDAEIESTAPGDERRDLVIARDFLLLDLDRAGLPADREHAAALLATVRGSVGAAADAAAAAEWPIGRVMQRRGAGLRVSVTASARADAGQELRFMRSRLMNIPVAAGADSFLPGLELAFDLHQQGGMIATDGFGRQLGEPFGAKTRQEAARQLPMFQPAGMDEASVLGRVVFVRAGGSLAAFEVSGQPRAVGQAAAAATGAERNRSLWMVPDAFDGSADARNAGFVMNVGAARAPRDGAVPLGARASEPRGPDDDARRMSMQCGRARCTGVPLLVDRTLRLHDPRSGAIIWERQRVAAGSELIGDDEVVVVCPPDGRSATVVSMADGRVLRTPAIPPAEQRLASSGRRIAWAQPVDARPGEAWARRVRVGVFDPFTGDQRLLGDFPGESRTAEAGSGRLAILEPSGDLTLIDIEEGRKVFRVRLADMPAGMQHVQIMPWRDRYLVLVGRAETPEEQKQLERIGAIGPLPGMPGRELPQVTTGSIWAVARDTGDMLWPVPVTILRHSLQRYQAAELPVMLFARSIQPAREPERPRLSLLCIDKRTGQAVFVDDRFSGRSPTRPDTMMMGCTLSGDPDGHTISFAQGGRDAPELQLEFTGQPAAPRPPFQATSPPAAADSVLDIEYWIKKAFALPFRF